VSHDAVGDSGNRADELQLFIRLSLPVQFAADPWPLRSDGAIAIDSGYYGDVVLDGVRIAVVFQWPGPIHEGRGRCQPIVDARASPHSATPC
jgi:hypothetical protein